MNILTKILMSFDKDFKIIKEQSTEFKVAFFSVASPILAFIYGYYYFKQRFWIVCIILAFSAYVVSVVYFPWATSLKLNMIFCIAYLVGSYPFEIKRRGLWFMKGYIGLIIIISPLYVLPSIPEQGIDYILSGIIIALGQYILWCGHRPEKLIVKHNY